MKTNLLSTLVGVAAVRVLIDVKTVNLHPVFALPFNCFELFFKFFSKRE